MMGEPGLLQEPWLSICCRSRRVHESYSDVTRAMIRSAMGTILMMGCSNVRVLR